MNYKRRAIHIPKSRAIVVPNNRRIANNGGISDDNSRVFDNDSFGNFTASRIGSISLSRSFLTGPVIADICRFTGSVFLCHNRSVNFSARGIVDGLFRPVALANDFALNAACRGDVLSMFAVVLPDCLFPDLAGCGHFLHAITRLPGRQFWRRRRTRRFFIHLTSWQLLSKLVPRVHVSLPIRYVFLAGIEIFLARIVLTRIEVSVAI